MADLEGSAPILWRWLLRRRGRSGLSADVARTLVAAAEVLLAPELTPKEVRAISRTAAHLLNQMSEAERNELCGHLEILERLVPILSRTGRAFTGLSGAARRKCLEVCEKSRWAALSDGHRKLRHLVSMAYLECHEAWPTLRPAATTNAQVA